MVTKEFDFDPRGERYFGKRVAALRMSLSETQETLAPKIDTAKNNLSKWETTPAGYMNRGSFQKFASGVGLTIVELRAAIGPSPSELELFRSMVAEEDRRIAANKRGKKADTKPGEIE